METYDYFENDGAYFRARANTGLAAVDDIWMGDQWEPYKGDCARRYLFGNKTKLANLPVAAGGEGRRPANVWCEGDDWDAFLKRMDEGIEQAKAEAETKKQEAQP
jgi:hypothetical protein